MSVNLSSNLGSFSNKFKKAEEPDDKEKEKRNRAAKQNPLLNAKTDPYVDDNDAYQVRISKADKLEYWRQLLPNKGTRRPLPKSFKSWKMRELAIMNGQDMYNKSHLKNFAFISSANWDHRSINVFIVWMILIIFYGDGYALNTYERLITYNAANQILAVPPLLIFIFQLIPFLGMLYYITHRNDLVHFRAITDIGKWVSRTYDHLMMSPFI